jgi:hypothetical protein
MLIALAGLKIFARIVIAVTWQPKCSGAQTFAIADVMLLAGCERRRSSIWEKRTART